MRSDLRYKMSNENYQSKRHLEGEKLIEPYRLAESVSYKSMGNLKGKEFQESLRRENESLPNKKQRKDFNLRFFLNEQTEKEKVKDLIEKIKKK